MLKIREIPIANPIAVAPMAGISNAAFRQIVKEMGAGLVVCEMISDQGIHYRNQKTLDMLYIAPDEWPLSVQIFGSKAETMAEAAHFVEENTEAAIIDINMGCPVNKVVKTDAGARVLLDPEEVYRRVKAVVSAVNRPVSVKMRTGWDQAHILATENALAAEAAGASMVAMHGRTRAQLYSGQADWEILGRVAEKMTIPFYGNGDIKTPQEAKDAIETYGVDGVMVGRACLGDPFVIRRMVHYLETGELMPAQANASRIAEAMDHLERLIALKGEALAVKEFRGLVSYYLKGIPKAAKVKVACTQANTKDDVLNLLEPFMAATAKAEANEGE